MVMSGNLAVCDSMEHGAVSGFEPKFYSESEGCQIPTATGLYAFYLEPLTPSALGFLNTEPKLPDSSTQ